MSKKKDVGGRVKCGWPPACKDFLAFGHDWSLAVMCPACVRGHEPQVPMGSVDRALIKPAGSRCPMTRDRYASIRRSTDDAITLFHPGKPPALVGTGGSGRRRLAEVLLPRHD